MTPEENRMLSFLGERVLVHFAQAFVAATLYGVYLLVFIISARILLRDSNAGQARTRLLLGLSTLLFISMTLRFASWCSFIVTQMTGLFVDGSDLPLGQRRPGVKARLTKFDIILYFGRSINLIVSDGIAIWRAWVLYKATNSARIIMAVASLVNAGLLIGVASLDAVIAGGSQAIDSHTFAVVISTSSFISSATNFLASVLIGMKAWKYRKTMKESFLHDQIHRSAIGRILRLLIETGVAFAVMQLVDAIMAVVYIDAIGVPSSRVLPAGIFDEVVIAFAAIYPVLVIILVQDKQTVVYNATLAHGNPMHDSSEGSGPASPNVESPMNPLPTMKFATSGEIATVASSSVGDREDGHETKKVMVIGGDPEKS